MRYSDLHLLQKSPTDFARCFILQVSSSCVIGSSNCSSSNTSVLLGRLRTLRPMSKCDGVSGSSKSSADKYERGLELTIKKSILDNCCQQVIHAGEFCTSNRLPQAYLGGLYHTLKHTTPPWGSLYIESPFYIETSKMTLDFGVLENSLYILGSSLKRFYIIRNNPNWKASSTIESA